LTSPAYGGVVPTDEQSHGVLLLRAWVHDGRVVARVHSWRQGEGAQVTRAIVGAESITGFVGDWIRELGREAPETPA
jgi:hypothetical protein